MDRHEKYSSNTKKHAPIAPAPKKANLGFCLLLPQAKQGSLGWIPKQVFYWPFSYSLLYLPQYVGNVGNVWAVVLQFTDHNL